MLRSKSQCSRNPYFHSHPMHSAFSLFAAMVLFGLMVGTIMWMH